MRRAARISIGARGLAIVLGVALMAVALVLGWIRSEGGQPIGSGQPRNSTTEASQPVAVEPRLIPGLGVTVTLEGLEPQEQRQALNAIAGAGFSWVRQRFPWTEIEPEPGRFAWSKWDGIVDGAAESGLTLVAVLDGSPAWARHERDEDNPLAPPHQRADFGRFAAAFAARYGDRVRFYQVWDEPNIAPHWGARPVSAVDYAGLLREAAVQLRSADGDAAVLLAALAPNTEPGGINQSDLGYLEALYQAGAEPWFDAVAGQPYGFEYPPEDPPDPDRLNFRRAELLRETMRRHGDKQKALWLTSFGWQAPLDGILAGEDGADEGTPWRGVDEATQSQWSVKALDYARRHWPWLGALGWAAWQPVATPEAVSMPRGRDGLALLGPDGRERPVLLALRSWLDTPQPLGPGVWPPDHPALRYAGGWRVTEVAADPPPQASIDSNQLSIPFEGTALALQVQPGPYWAYLTATVDGQPAAALPQDGDGQANLVLYDPLAAPKTVFVARDLPAGLHTVDISATGGWEQWPLLGIEVRLGEEAARWTGAAPALSLLLLFMAGAALVGGGLAMSRPPRDNGRQPSPVGNRGPASSATTAGQDNRLQAAGLPVKRLRWAMYGMAGALLGAALLSAGYVSLAVLIALFALLLFHPPLGLFLIGLAAALFLVPVTLLGRPFNPAEVVVWATAGALVARTAWHWVKSHRAGWNTAARLTGLDAGVLALLAVSAASLLVADNFGVASRELRTVILAGALAYGLVRLTPPDRDDGSLDPWPTVWGIGLGAAAVALWGIFQAAAGTGLITAEGVLRVRGPYGSPNNLGLYLGHVLPILLAIAAFAQIRSRRLAAALLALPIAVALVLTFSKGALLLGLPAAILFLGLAGSRMVDRRWLWVAVVALMAGALALLPLFRTERFAGLLDLQGGTTFLRLQLWRGAWNMILDHPWLGVGLDNFLYAYRTTYVLPTGWQELNLSHPHNIVLDFWTRLGLVGVVVGIWLFVAAFRQGWQALRLSAAGRKAILLGLLASLVATLAHGLIDNSVFLVDLMLLFMLTLGLIARLQADAPRLAGGGEAVDDRPGQTEE